MASPRSHPSTGGGAPLRMITMVLLLASALIVDVNNAESSTTPPPPEELHDNISSIKSFSAREFAEFASTKRLIAPEKSLDDWSQVGLATRITGGGTSVDYT